jgi:hypothetical protein
VISAKSRSSRFRGAIVSTLLRKETQSAQNNLCVARGPERPISQWWTLQGVRDQGARLAAADARNDEQGCQRRATIGHSITSSARASNVGGMDRPSALAVFKLIARSNLVGSWIGKSLGLAPLRMRSIYPAPSWKDSGKLGP